MLLLEKLFSILKEVFTLFNIISFSLIIISLLLIIMILVQRNSDGYSETKNIFGPNVRIDSQLNVTYSLIALFVIHVLALNILTNIKYKQESLTQSQGVENAVERRIKIRKIVRKD